MAAGRLTVVVVIHALKQFARFMETKVLVLSALIDYLSTENKNQKRELMPFSFFSKLSLLERGITLHIMTPFTSSQCGYKVESLSSELTGGE